MSEDLQGRFWSGNEGRKDEMILRPYTQIPVRTKKIPVPGKDEDCRKCQEGGVILFQMYFFSSSTKAKTVVADSAFAGNERSISSRTFRALETATSVNGYS